MDQRLQKIVFGDGPAERQILLLKLTHELENAPSFGAAYIASADSVQQRWLSRIGALLTRVSLEHKINFRATKATSVQYWQVTREKFRQQLLEAIEEIKLELELDGRDQIGQIYDAGKEYDFFVDLKGIISGASDEIFIVDAYMDGATFDAYVGGVSSVRSVRILCGQYVSDVATYAKKYAAQTGAIAEIRKTRDIHDRVIFIDRTDCWIVGASIKDAGKRPTYLIPLMPQISPQKLAIYEAVWSNATAVSI